VRRVFGGAALVIAGIAAFIEAHSHRPVPTVVTRARALRERRLDEIGVAFHRPMSGLSPTAYDLLRIGAALVIVGGLLVVVGLIDHWRRVSA
jgi:hypothetical protein